MFSVKIVVGFTLVKMILAVVKPDVVIDIKDLETKMKTISILLYYIYVGEIHAIIHTFNRCLSGVMNKGILFILQLNQK